MRDQYWFFIALFLYGSNSYAQYDDGYPSAEEKEYYKKNKHQSFVPVDTATILAFTTPYAKIYSDTSAYHIYDNEKGDYAFPKEAKEQFDRNKDTIASIKKRDFLKYEKKGNVSVALFRFGAFDDNLHDLWIAYSKDSGVTWKYYYTGIVQEQPLYVKWYSTKPLLNDNGNIVIEACLLRRITPLGGMALYAIGVMERECVKDGLLVEFDINEIIKDRDNDGLTDIVEQKIYTNKYKKDTDGDGIADNKDMNPLVNLPATEKSKIFQAIVNEDINWDADKKSGVLTFITNSIKTDEMRSPRLIVTDDKDLIRIQPKKYPLIFLSTEAFKKSLIPYYTHLPSISVSPLFKIDNQSDTYKITVGYPLHGYTLLVKKIKKIWTVKYLSSYVV